MPAIAESVEVAYERPYVARRPFQYVDLELDSDQVFMLARQVNDERLVRLNFCVQAPRGASIVQCGYCGAKFCTDTGLNMHGRKRHGNVSVPTVREDRKRLTPDELNRDLARAQTDPRLMSLAGEPDAVKTPAMLAEEKLLQDPSRALRMDKTEASVRAGEGVAEISTVPAKKRGRPKKAAKE